jgi:hypothetical protein
MAKQREVPGKAKKESDRKFKIEAVKEGEAEVDIELLAGGNYIVEKLETEDLPKSMPDGTSIRWFNNFSIKENGSYINKTYKVTIPGLRGKLREKNSQLVIYSDRQDPKLYYYKGTIDGDTFELNDGDPGAGAGP